MPNKDNSEKQIKAAKLIAYNFLSVLISKKSLTKLGDFYPNVESRKLAREWFALQLFLMVIGISSFYKKNPQGLEIARFFRINVIEGLVEAGVYGSIDEATEFIKARLNIYDKESSKKKNNPLMNMSIQFLKFIEQNDALLLVNTGEQITTFLMVNKNLVEKVNKQIFLS